MCREILNTCVRNTEEAERSAQQSTTSATTSTTASVAGTPTSATGPMTSGRGQGKGVWNMIEESELARSIKKDDQKKVRTVSGFSSLSSVLDRSDSLTDERGLGDGGDVSVGHACGAATAGAAGVGVALRDAGAGAGWRAVEQSEGDLVSQAKEYKTKLESMLASIPSSSSSSTSSSPVIFDMNNTSLIDATKALLRSLANAISSLSTTTTSPTSNVSAAESMRLAYMLELYDGLTELMAKAMRLTRPNLSVRLQGLGLDLNGVESQDSVSRLGMPSGSAGPGSGSSPSIISTTTVVTSSNGSANGHAFSDDTETDTGDEGELKVETPRVDKGKGRAVPEPEKLERVLSPTGYGLESDEEGDGEGELRLTGLAGLGMGGMEGLKSPTDR